MFSSDSVDITHEHYLRMRWQAGHVYVCVCAAWFVGRVRRRLTKRWCIRAPRRWFFVPPPTNIKKCVFKCGSAQIIDLWFTRG